MHDAIACVAVACTTACGSMDPSAADALTWVSDDAVELPIEGLDASWTQRLALLSLVSGLAACEPQEPPAGDEVFIATRSDFEGFVSWEHFEVDPPQVVPNHVLGDCNACHVAVEGNDWVHPSLFDLGAGG